MGIGSFPRVKFGRGVTLTTHPLLAPRSWKSRAIPQTNRELEELSKGENIVICIKEKRIWWLGHLKRMHEDRMPIKIFTQELEGTRRRGSPRKGWREEVERELVIDREKWRGIFRQAKAHSGL